MIPAYVTKKILEANGVDISVGGHHCEGDNDRKVINIDPGFGKGTHVEGDNNSDITNIDIFNKDGGIRIDGDNNGTAVNCDIDTK